MSVVAPDLRSPAPRCLVARRPESGTTFVELMGAITIVALATLVMLHQLSISYREGNVQQDRLWAYEKGTQLMAELQSAVERGVISDAEGLHARADAQPNPVMTTVTDSLGQPLAPDHPMSGNWRRFDRWVWLREIEVTAPPGQDRLRYVKVRLSKCADNGRVHLITALTQVFPLPRRTWPSTVVHDVYLLALPEVPSLLAPLSQLRSEVDAAFRRASSEAPSAAFRLHWITRLGYGRDQLYTPFVNVGTDVAAVTPRAYWYPQRLTASSQLFVPSYFTGRYRTESASVNDYDVSALPLPHAIADQFNHCLRLPEARELFAARVAAGLEDVDTPPLQVLLADMLEFPDRYRNAILLNLHGDALPFPPMRNYADAARAPEVYPGLRVVTHPRRLRTVRDANGDGNNLDSDDLELRVHAWRENSSVTGAVTPVPITLQIAGGDFRSHLDIKRLPGGIDLATGQPGPVSYSSFDSMAGVPPTADPGTAQMWYEVGYSSSPKFTWIRLHNTPLVCQAVGLQGLASNHRLYGYEYVPGPLAQDLSTASNTPKNTARWRIRISRNALGGVLANGDQKLKISTRLGTDLSTGSVSPVANQPLNLSVTHAWWTRTTSAVPLTERFQFLGDPRHSPYADLAMGGDLANGYNPYFAGSGISSSDAMTWQLEPDWITPAGFGEAASFDAPRMLQVWRAALQSTGAVLTNMGGPIANRVLLGGEIASSTGNSQPGKVAMPGSWFGATGTVLVDSVSSTDSVAAAPPTEPMAMMLGEQLVMSSTTDFWAKPWLGELCPDASYSDWYSIGNLGSGFVRVPRSMSTPANLPTGAAFVGLATGATLGPIGATTLFQAGSEIATFSPVHQANGVALQARQGSVVSRLFGFSWPANPLSPEHWTAVGPGDAMAPHFRFPSHFPAQTLTLLESHMNSNVSGLSVGGLLQIEPPGGGSAGFVELLSSGSGSAADLNLLIEHAVADSLRAIHRAGEPAVSARIEQIGRVELVEPPKGAVLAKPASVKLTWSVDFRRFDGELPTTAYPTDFTEDETAMAYVILYSRNGGETWFNALDHAAAEPGARPGPGVSHITDAGPGNESVSVPLPVEKYPAGEVLFRVEAHRATARELHHGHHTLMVTVTR